MFDHEKLNGVEHQRTRELLATQELYRLRAIAEFPLSVATAARDLIQLLRFVEFGTSEQRAEASNACAALERLICGEFARRFGHAMIQPPAPSGAAESISRDLEMIDLVGFENWTGLNRRRP